MLKKILLILVMLVLIGCNSEEVETPTIEVRQGVFQEIFGVVPPPDCSYDLDALYSMIGKERSGEYEIAGDILTIYPGTQDVSVAGFVFQNTSPSILSINTAGLKALENAITQVTSFFYSDLNDYSINYWFQAFVMNPNTMQLDCNQGAMTNVIEESDHAILQMNVSGMQNVFPDSLNISAEMTALTADEISNFFSGEVSLIDTSFDTDTHQLTQTEVSDLNRLREEILSHGTRLAVYTILETQSSGCSYSFEETYAKYLQLRDAWVMNSLYLTLSGFDQTDIQVRGAYFTQDQFRILYDAISGMTIINIDNQQPFEGCMVDEPLLAPSN